MHTNFKPVLGVIFLVITTWVAVLLTCNSDEAVAPDCNPLPAPFHRYHFVFIAQGPESAYWHQVLKGMQPMIRQEKIGMEFYTPNPAHPSEAKQLLEKAVLRGCDGIILALPDHPDFQELFNAASDRDIPLVMLGNASDSNRIAFVGISASELGYQTGKVLREIITEPTKAALLRNPDFSPNGNRQYLTGLQEGLGPDPLLQISLIVNSNGKNVQAVEQTQAIMENYPEIQVLICSNSEDTLGIAKLTVALNQGSRMTILGAGFSAAVAPYLRNKVIRGVLAADPVTLGAQGLATLLRLKISRIHSENHPLPLYWIDSENLGHFTQRFSTVPFSKPSSPLPGPIGAKTSHQP